MEGNKLIMKRTILILAISLISTAIFAQSKDTVKYREISAYYSNKPTRAIPLLQAFNQGDTVINVTNHYIFKRFAIHYIFIVGAVVFRGNKKHPFYDCHFVDDGSPALSVSENSIKKVHLYWVENMGPYIKD